MEKTQQFIGQNKDRFIAELLSLLRIPSVSADPAFQQEVTACARHLATHLTEIGLDSVEVIATAGHPIVYAEKIMDASLPTVLVYGHYDVQPADPLELWHTPAFEPVIKSTAIHPDGAIFARGACDDKGQFFMHVKAVEAMLQTQELPCNLKLMIEGEEEVGSPNLAVFVRENKSKLKADIILV
jgi:acetylornithine deacetylase/succinyl-diaminopimelate desuccinylase-like protein